MAAEAFFEEVLNQEAGSMLMVERQGFVMNR